MITRIISLFLFVLTCLPALAQYGNYVLVFQDNFDGTSLDTTILSKIPRGRSDWNRHMSPNPSLYSVDNGMLKLYARLNNGIVANDRSTYITGGVWSKGKKAIRYGKVEVKAKFRCAQGTWPAIWMLPENAKWPYGGEIDIMEHLNYESCIYQTIHSNYTYYLGQKTDPQSHAKVSIQLEQYNVYGVEIHPERIDFFVNGQCTFSYPRIEDKASEGQFPFGEEPFYLLIDMQVGGNWVGNPNPQDYPSWMDVEWVKMYELSE